MTTALTTKKYCNSPNDIPDGDHFAIIEFSTIHIPGDERSRTNPGHGYPASSETVSRYISFTSIWEWEKDIEGRMNPTYGQPKNNFVALQVRRAAIETTVTVKVS